jgi:serine/threonine protein kinase
MLNPQSMVGRILDDKYAILSIAGSGGMAVVFQARQLGLERLAAIKVLHASVNLSKQGVERFKREAKILSALVHKNIGAFYGFGVLEDNSYYIAMEYVDGFSFRQLLDMGPLPYERTLKIIMSVCDAIAYAHQAGVIHRDLKPENIMILKGPDADIVKVMDFGLAKLVAPEFSDIEKLTVTGMLVGTAQYLSPELISNGKADHRSDVYSLACILYESLSGKLPFTAESPGAYIYQHKNQIPEAPSRKSAFGLPSGTDEVVLKGLAKDPADRYQSVADLQDDLKILLDGAGLKTNAYQSGEFHPPDPSKRNNLLVFGAGLFAFITIILLGLLAFERNSKVSTSLHVAPKKTMGYSAMKQLVAEVNSSANTGENLQLGFKLLQASRNAKNKEFETVALSRISETYSRTGKPEKSIEYAKQLEILLGGSDGTFQFGTQIWRLLNLIRLAENYRDIRRYDSALAVLDKIDDLSKSGKLQLDSLGRLNLLAVRISILKNQGDLKSLSDLEIEEKKLFASLPLDDKVTVIGALKNQSLIETVSAEEFVALQKLALERYERDDDPVFNLPGHLKRVEQIAQVMSDKEAREFLRKFYSTAKDAFQSNNIARYEILTAITNRSKDTLKQPEWAELQQLKQQFSPK